jgi:hypothetical protein
MDLKINMSVEGIATSSLDENEIISNDVITKISFAAGGEKGEYVSPSVERVCRAVRLCMRPWPPSYLGVTCAHVIVWGLWQACKEFAPPLTDQVQLLVLW